MSQSGIQEAQSAALSKEKARAYGAKWRAANRESDNASSAKWVAANREKHKAAVDKWRAANRDKCKADGKKWRAANPEKVRASKVKWHSANTEKAKAISLKWHADHPDARRIRAHNRRAKLRESGTLSKGLAEKLFVLQKGKCACCSLRLGKNYHMDHKMPLALGGKNEDWNMQLLRQRCNNQKHATHPVDFMQSRGFLL